MKAYKVMVASLVFLLGTMYGAFPGTISSGDITGPPGSVMVDSIIWTGLNSSDNVVSVVCSLYVDDGDVAYFYNGEDYPHIMWHGQARDWYDNLIPSDPNRWMFPAAGAYVDTSFWDQFGNLGGFPPVDARVYAVTGGSFSSGTNDANPLVVYFFLQLGWTDGVQTNLHIRVKAYDNNGQLLGSSDLTKTIHVQSPQPVSLSGHVDTWNGHHIAGAYVYLEGGNIGSAVDTTESDGTFLFSGLNQGYDYTVYVEKDSGLFNSAISVYDAYLVAHTLAGGGSLSDNQKRVANTQQGDSHFAHSPYNVPNQGVGENNLNENDVRAILAYLVGRPDHVADNYTGFWFFYPYWKDYNDLTSNVTNADFTGYLMGDVDGNYTKKGNSSEAPVVKVEEFTPGKSVSKVYVKSLAHGFTVEIKYNPSVTITGITKASGAPADLIYDYSIGKGVIKIAAVTVNGKINGHIFDIHYKSDYEARPLIRKAGFDNTYYVYNANINDVRVNYRGGSLYFNSRLIGSFMVELYSIDGRRLVAKEVNGTLGKVHVGNLPMGVYFVRVKSSEANLLTKLVILR